MTGPEREVPPALVWQRLAAADIVSKFRVLQIVCQHKRGCVLCTVVKVPDMLVLHVRGRIVKQAEIVRRGAPNERAVRQALAAGMPDDEAHGRVYPDETVDLHVENERAHYVLQCSHMVTDVFAADVRRACAQSSPGRTHRVVVRADGYVPLLPFGASQ